MAARSRGMMIIDLFGLSEEDVRHRFPAVFQHLLLHVKPERDASRDNGPDSAQYARQWWLHGKPRPELRNALSNLTRFIATGETSKHRIFVFQPATLLPDNMLVCIASAEAWHLGVLSSRFHVAWSFAAGGWIGFGNDPRYNKTRCFDPFPFPSPTPKQTIEIAKHAEALDAHRAARLSAHRHLTLTGLYNVLEALRANRPLSESELDILEAGQVAILQHLHDQLDQAVAVAYGWQATLPANTIVERIIELNYQRVAEEQAGQVRWLRPDFQSSADVLRKTVQTTMDVDEGAKLPPWPKLAPAQFVALRAALVKGGPFGASDLARQFRGAPSGKVAGMLATLAALGQARETGPGRYVA
jgi:hypothetical protein